MTEIDTSTSFSIPWSPTKQRLLSYKARGREHERTARHDLERLYIDSHRQWASRVGDPVAYTLVNDLSAEFELRGIDPPFQAVASSLRKVEQRLRQQFAVKP